MRKARSPPQDGENSLTLHGNDLFDAWAERDEGDASPVPPLASYLPAAAGRLLSSVSSRLTSSLARWVSSSFTAGLPSAPDAGDAARGDGGGAPPRTGSNTSGAEGSVTGPSHSVAGGGGGVGGLDMVPSLDLTFSFDSDLSWLSMAGGVSEDVRSALLGARPGSRIARVLAAALESPVGGARGLTPLKQSKAGGDEPPRSLAADLVVSGAAPDGSFRGASSSGTAPVAAGGRSEVPRSLFSDSIVKTHHTTTTADLWTLHLMHAVDESVPRERRHRHPVLLVPGLASCGLGTFDLLPQVSLVDYLASRGWDVWCASLRGNGRSSKPAFLDATTYWTIDDHLCQDVPAVLEFVLRASGAAQVHWVGHSMGGMLGCGLLSQAGKYAAALRSVTLLGSGCFGDGSWHSVLKPIVRPIVRLGFPAGVATQGLALLADTPAALSLFEVLFFWAANMEPAVRKSVLQRTFNFIPEPLVGQFLASHDSPTGLTNVAGTFLYANPGALGALRDMPLLAMNGDWDLFCPPAGAARTASLFGSRDKRVLVFGPGNGHRSHYGHFDIIQGRHARNETWPHLAKFLADNDAPCAPDALPEALSAAAHQSALDAQLSLLASVGSSSLPPHLLAQLSAEFAASGGGGGDAAVLTPTSSGSSSGGGAGAGLAAAGRCPASKGGALSVISEGDEGAMSRRSSRSGLPSSSVSGAATGSGVSARQSSGALPSAPGSSSGPWLSVHSSGGSAGRGNGSAATGEHEQRSAGGAEE